MRGREVMPIPSGSWIVCLANGSDAGALSIPLDKAKAIHINLNFGIPLKVLCGWAKRWHCWMFQPIVTLTIHTTKLLRD